MTLKELISKVSEPLTGGIPIAEIRQFGDEAVSALVAVLDSPDKRVRQQICFILGEVGASNSSVLTAIRKLINSREKHDVRAALKYFAKIGAAGHSAGHEISAIASHSDAGISQYAHFALYRLGEPIDIIKYVLDELAASDERRRHAALLARKLPADSRLDENLRRLLYHNDPKTACAAARSLTRRGSHSRESITIILELLKNENEEIHLAAECALLLLPQAQVSVLREMLPYSKDEELEDLISRVIALNEH